MKLCKTCVSKKNLKLITTTKTKKLWKKGFSTKTEFPKDKKPSLKNIKLKSPKDYSIKVNISMGDDFKNRYIYYYASKPNKDCCHVKTWDKAYDNFQNSGIAKFDKKGNAVLKIKRPQHYIEDNFTYFPHVHFLVSNKNNTKWNDKLYTKAVIIKIDKKELKRYINNRCHVILNALPYEYYVKNRIPNSLPLPHNLVGDKLDSKDIVSYLKKMIVHYPKIQQALKEKKLNIKQIPIVTYCWDKTCSASEHLMEKLWNMGFSNIIEYPDGIQGWLNKT